MQPATNRKYVLIGLSIMLLAGIVIAVMPVPVIKRVIYNIRGKQTLEQRIVAYGSTARDRFLPAFKGAGIKYPPKKLIFVGIKQEKKLEIYAANSGSFKYIKSYPILAASGKLGPKLREGDRQVPEGIYKITYLNPNSLYHLALRVGYPNEFDREKGISDGRTKLGQDIMIHGSNCSIGCLAMGDQASEDLFVLAADTGIGNIKVILSPVDFRKTSAVETDKPLPQWVPELYSEIKNHLNLLKNDSRSGS